MNAVDYMNIENALMLSTLLLILWVVWIATRIIKLKARYVYDLHRLLMEKRTI